jgi:hypothetical protein
MNFLKRLLCKMVGHEWEMRESYPYERTGTSKDLAMIPGICVCCGHKPTPQEVVEFAQYEGKVESHA